MLGGVTMTIGSIFCNECRNIHTDVNKAFSAIRGHFKEDTFITSEESCEADLWLLICGCTNPCIEHGHLRGKFGKLFVMSDGDIPKAIHMIELLKEDKEAIDFN